MDNLIKQVHELSISYTKNTDLAYLKKLGQYFTVDKQILDRLLDDYVPRSEGKLNILEPSCGTGCIIGECLKLNTEYHISGIDIDENIVQKTKVLFKKVPSVDISHGDFLKQSFDTDFDLIIGNPPYFELPSSQIDETVYGEIMCGRTNIYSLFIYKSIKLLKDGGELRFVIPKTVLSGRYFSKLRSFIHKECEVIDIINFDKSTLFSKALQSVIILKLRKTNNEARKELDKHVVVLNDQVYLVKDARQLNMSSTDTTIRKLGCTVKTGSIVWNQHKKDLHNECINDKTLPLIMASNINSGELCIKSSKADKKKQYLRITKENAKFIQNAPFLLTNRIIGMNPPKLNVVLVDKEGCYFIENHVNVIKGSLDVLKLIEASLKQDTTQQFIQQLLGSTQLSQYELENIIPIKLASC
jgi:adenine-specific DNA-methyltransferase